MEEKTVSQTDKIRIGVSPLSWVNEVLPEFGADTTADQCLSEAAEAGYQGVELSKIFPKNASALSTLLAKYHLSLVSGWHNGFLADKSVEEEVENVREHASLLKACGVKVMVYGECARMPENALDIGMSQRWLLKSDEYAAYGDRLTRFADILKEQFDLELAYHHHLMMVAETLDEVRAVMAATGPSVGLLLDTGHAFAGGFDYATLITEFGPRINHIHLKDVRADVLKQVRDKDLSFNDGVRNGMFTVPGDGSVDYSALAEFLKQGRYNGWLVVEAEQDPLKAPPFDAVKRAYHYITSHIYKP